MILSPKWPVYPNQVFFWKNHQINIHVPFDPFYSAKLQKKILRVDTQLSYQKEEKKLAQNFIGKKNCP